MHRTRASALTRCRVKTTACRRHARGLWCSYLRPARAALARSPSGRSAQLGAAPYTRPSARTTDHERDGDVGTHASASHVVFQSGRIAHACVAHRASGSDVCTARQQQLQDANVAVPRSQLERRARRLNAVQCRVSESASAVRPTKTGARRAKPTHCQSAAVPWHGTPSVRAARRDAAARCFTLVGAKSRTQHAGTTHAPARLCTQ
jgi:hypothetical protein